MANQPLSVFGVSHSAVRRCSIASVLIPTPQVYNGDEVELRATWAAHGLLRNNETDAQRINRGCIELIKLHCLLRKAFVSYNSNQVVLSKSEHTYQFPLISVAQYGASIW